MSSNADTFASEFMLLCQRWRKTACCIVLEPETCPKTAAGLPQVALTISGYPPLKKIIEDALKVETTGNRKVTP